MIGLNSILPAGSEPPAQQPRQNSIKGAFEILPRPVIVEIFRHTHNIRVREVSKFFKDLMNEVYKTQLLQIDSKRPGMIQSVFENDSVLDISGILKKGNLNLCDNQRAFGILFNLFEDTLEKLTPLEASKSNVKAFMLNPRFDIHGLQEIESWSQDFNLLKIAYNLGRELQTFLSRDEIVFLPPQLKASIFRDHLRTNARNINIAKLDLSHLSLTEFPLELTWITSLKELDLSENKIRTLPPEIGNLINLENLDLDDNKLRSLPSEIGNLTALNTLSLIYNELSDLPDEVKHLVNLVDLDLNGNKLSFIWEKLKDLPKLESIDLRKNGIWSMEEKQKLKRAFDGILMDL